MSWLWRDPRKLAWNESILVDASTGQVFAMIASFTHKETGTKIWGLLPWSGYWKEDMSVVYISREDAMKAAENKYR